MFEHALFAMTGGTFVMLDCPTRFGIGAALAGSVPSVKVDTATAIKADDTSHISLHEMSPNARTQDHSATATTVPRRADCTTASNTATPCSASSIGT